MMLTINKRSAFTLVELLVVVAVITILIALITPTLRNAINTARQTACMNNLSQVYIASMEYTRDYNGYLPQAMGDSYDNWATWNRYIHGGWIWSASSYTGPAVKFEAPSYVARDVFNCPIHLTIEGNDLDSTASRRSYGLNLFTADYFRVTRLKNPGRVFMTGDSYGASTFHKRSSTCSIYRRHQGKANILYYAGNVSSLYFEEIPVQDAWNTLRFPWFDEALN